MCVIGCLLVVVVLPPNRAWNYTPVALKRWTAYSCHSGAFCEATKWLIEAFRFGSLLAVHKSQGAACSQLGADHWATGHVFYTAGLRSALLILYTCPKVGLLMLK